MESIYQPHLAVVKNITDETIDTKTFTLQFMNSEYNKQFRYKSGQFVEASLYGVGEAPFGLCSNPNQQGEFAITVRTIGCVTEAMHKLMPGDVLGIRGPLGNHFPLEEVKGYDILIIAGGIGLPPLKSLIEPMLDCRNDFGQFIILYGARTPENRVYKSILQEWHDRSDIQLLQTVDKPDDSWTGNVGVVTTLFEKIKLDVRKTIAYTCGPPVMIRFVIQELLLMGLPEDHIISTLERHMKCGIGKCGHCAIGHKYICVDGPVFSYRQIKRLPEK
jgi:sulfhydrogenase subunit gamma (sulfur reductase)